MWWIVSIIADNLSDIEHSCDCNKAEICNCLSTEQLKLIEELSRQEDSNCTNCGITFTRPAGLPGCDLTIKIYFKGGSSDM